MDNGFQQADAVLLYPFVSTCFLLSPVFQTKCDVSPVQCKENMTCIRDHYRVLLISSSFSDTFTPLIFVCNFPCFKIGFLGGRCKVVLLGVGRVGRPIHLFLHHLS